MSCIVLLEIQVKPESVNEVKALLKAILQDTRSYAGCEGLDIYDNLDKQGNMVFHERWESPAHYQKYLAWRTETGALEKLGAHLAGPPSIRYFNRIAV